MTCKACKKPMDEHVIFGTKWGAAFRICPRDIIEEVIE